MTGRNRRGRPQWDRALTPFDPRALIARVSEFGIDLSAQWEESRYRAALRDDIERGIAYNLRLDHHPSGRAAIARDLARVRRHFADGADEAG